MNVRSRAAELGPVATWVGVPQLCLDNAVRHQPVRTEIGDLGMSEQERGTNIP